MVPKTKRPVLKCNTCSKKIEDSERGREEMELHEDECSGLDDPRERFEVGDRVQYSDFGRKRLGKDHREGEVAGFSQEPNGHCVRVRWDGNKTASRYAHAFIKHLED